MSSLSFSSGVSSKRHNKTVQKGPGVQPKPKDRPRRGTHVSSSGSQKTRRHLTSTQKKQAHEVQLLRNLYSTENAPDKLRDRTVCHANTTVYHIDKGACFREARERWEANEQPEPLDKIPNRGTYNFFTLAYETYREQNQQKPPQQEQKTSLTNSSHPDTSPPNIVSSSFSSSSLSASTTTMTPTASNSKPKIPPAEKIIKRGDKRDSVLECFQMDPQRNVLGKDWDEDKTTAAETFYERIVKKELDRRDLRFTGSIAGLATNCRAYYRQYSAQQNFVEFLRDKIWYQNVDDKGPLTHGHRYEEAARQEFLVWYRSTYGKRKAKVLEFPMKSSPQCPWVGISVDGILYDNEDEDGDDEKNDNNQEEKDITNKEDNDSKDKDPLQQRPTPQSVVEIKCPFFNMHTQHHPFSPSYVKPEYMSQIQLYAGYLNRYFSDKFNITSIYFVVWQPHQTFITYVHVDDSYYVNLMKNMQKAYFLYFLPCLIARERKELGYKELLPSVENLDTSNYQSLMDKKVEEKSQTTMSLIEQDEYSSSGTDQQRIASGGTTLSSSPLSHISYFNVFYRRECENSHISSPVVDWTKEPNWITMEGDDTDGDNDNGDDDNDDEDDGDNNNNDDNKNNDQIEDDDDDDDEEIEDVDTDSDEGQRPKANTQVDPPTSAFPDPWTLGEGHDATHGTFRNWYYKKYIRCVYVRSGALSSDKNIYKEKESSEQYYGQSGGGTGVGNKRKRVSSDTQEKAINCSQELEKVLNDAHQAWLEGFKRIVVDFCTCGVPTTQDMEYLCQHVFTQKREEEEESDDDDTSMNENQYETEHQWAFHCEYVFPFSAFGYYSWLLDEFQRYAFRFYVRP